MIKVMSAVRIVAFLLLVAVTTSACATTAVDREAYNPKIEPGDFSSRVDNEFFNLKPGRKFIYKGKSAKGTERIEVVTTKKTKKIMNITTAEVRDRVWLNGELIEDTKDWYAQDRKGSVWYFGEDSKEYRSGEIVSSEGSWEAGVDGAKPGLVMPGKPRAGQSYRQEYYKGVAEDMGDIVALNQKVVVPFGAFERSLKTRDWSKLEKSLNEYKYYSPDVGFVVLEESVDGKEKVELINVTE